MKKLRLIIFIIWLFLVIIWNYGYPEASPFLDVLAVIVLALFQFFILKFLNKN